MAKRKLTPAEREESEALHRRVMANAQRTRKLAEKAQAKLEAEARERERAQRTAEG
ncbi:MAG TPA: hypothetical protein VFK17_01875 [Gaiellaceae bacterium]|jgi:hypothetical protein|nr:hypothetical protein [Gaiellaceae bacterium]